MPALFSRIVSIIDEKKRLCRFAFKTSLGLTLSAIIPFAVVYFYGPELFGFVFGEEWTEAGVLGSIMTIWLFMKSQIVIILPNTPASVHSSPNTKPKSSGP